MNGVNFSFIHVYDDGNFCSKKSDKKVYDTPGTAPGSSGNTGGSGLTEEEKATLTAAVGRVDTLSTSVNTLSTSLENHVGDYNNPHRVKIGQIEGLTDKLNAVDTKFNAIDTKFNSVDTALGAANEITDEQLAIFRSLMEAYDTNTTVVQNTVVETLDGTEGQGTTINKTVDNKVSVDINLADNLTLVEKESEPSEGETTGKTTTAISQCWTSYDADATEEEPSESGESTENAPSEWGETND